MKIIPSNYSKKTALPLKIKISFEAVFDYLEKTAQDKNHILNSTAIELLEEYKQYPILRDGFEDFNLLDTYKKEISKLLDILFPELLESNEIKAVTIPFEFTSFKLSKRLEKILDDAGKDYELTLRNFDESHIYIMTCTFILSFCYDTKIDFRRPFYFDIPDADGFLRHYRTLYNGDFFKVKTLENAPKVTEDDIKLLLDNFDNIELWKEKFPVNSYEFKGFGIMNLFDVTSDQLISNLKENLIVADHSAAYDLEQNISNLYGSQEIRFEFSTFTWHENELKYRYFNHQNSFIMHDENCDCKGYFCDGVLKKVFENREILAISDVEKYGKSTGENGFYKSMKSHDIQSIILVPLQLTEELMGVMEIVSKKKYELNSINAYKLKDIIPVFNIAAKRYIEEFDNKLESVIQEYYTSLHPTVKWKFYEAAEEYLTNLENGDDTSANLKSIVFDNVVPLYGQCDIKGSSFARNNAIQKDLVKQLNLASKVIGKAKKIVNLPIYDDLIFRIDDYKNSIKNGLNAGDEVTLIYFLKQDIYPVFNHLKTLNSELRKAVEDYMNQIDSNLHIIYDERKKYEESVNTLNEELVKFIDIKQIEAQEMFPHYFERYKTDGVDFNMYIGQSLVRNRTYNEMYLFNLRLWQLQMMCEAEIIANNLKETLEHPLEIASLILVHSTPMAIKFRMDEKRFDVDGAYNIRYEIVKKRIDKAHIKNTNERLTQPGKIAIVYNQKNEADEYLKYIKHLQAMNYLTDEVENVDIEDLQGTTGLKALRIAINYKTSDDENITLDSLMKVLNKEKLN